jgi:uncharacterized protein (DUF302 family)
MTSSTQTTRTVRRLTVDVNAPFDEFRERYEAAVPAYDLTRLAALSSWEAVIEDAERAAPDGGFLRFATIDSSPVFAVAGHKARSVIYLMGNHTIAETMYRHDPAVMLYAPLRLCLFEDHDGNTHFAVDQPSDQFGSFDNPDVAATGQLLDQKLAALLGEIGRAHV